VNRYYHVMKKQGQWHLYAGNAISALMVDVHRANIVKAARTLARHNGAKVILHRDETDAAPTSAQTVYTGANASGH
jgi:hypothetical protein